MGRCFACSKDDWEAIFGICWKDCSYIELLRVLPEAQGVIVEALNERVQISRMLGHILSWALDTRILHISVAHLSKDYTRTMRCIDIFLGARGGLSHGGYAQWPWRHPPGHVGFLKGQS